ncbi:MAG TPA: SIS domain-containing protein [Candidatus Dormibacteraeota bacterium]|nr:SIS domain-containing protein [Candidatus Dormibacteraeota bacterium]
MHRTDFDSQRSVTLTEILSQPAVWQAQFAELKQSALIETILQQTSSRTEWLFIGCGTSYYLAEAAACTWTMVTGQRARALPASEVLLFRESSYLKPDGLQSVIISRSGTTSEAVRAARLLSQELRVPTIAITCAADSALERACDQTIRISAADEKSIVMTRSFTTMLMALQHLAARAAKQEDFLESQLAVTTHFAPQISSLCQRVEAFVENRAFEDFIFLGQGPFHAIAREAALKVMEMSCSYSQVFHTLEFRHGPKAVVSSRTCLTFFLSETAMDAESELLAEMKELGGSIIAICNRATDAVRRSSDFVFELGFNGVELATLLPCIVPLQLLGFFTALGKNLNPDEPKNLSRVVILS